MTGMTRTLTSIESPHSPEVIRIVEALLADGPMDAALQGMLRAAASSTVAAEAKALLLAQDWANLGRYEAANAALVAANERPDLVMMGNSITEIWPMADASFFVPGRVARGIAGQTSPQALIRFQPDVIALRPKSVHLLCGTNDIAGNTGPTTPYRFRCNVQAMTNLAKASGIRVYLASLLPVTSFLWAPEIDARPWVQELNEWLRDWAEREGHVYVDYYQAMVDDHDAMRAELSRDGVHPNRRGYAVMRRVLEPMI